jgi:multicomponent Na+:H+ antiporter subunit B
MKDYLILRVVTKLLLPFILLFALYVQFHGDLGPGGGFQAGVIFAAAFVLYALVFGVEAAQKIIPLGTLRTGVGGGVLIYAGVGFAGLFLGAPYLDYSALWSDPVSGQHIGIGLVEFGVGLTVACVMMTVFFTFATWRK